MLTPRAENSTSNSTSNRHCSGPHTTFSYRSYPASSWAKVGLACNGNMTDRHYIFGCSCKALSTRCSDQEHCDRQSTQPSRVRECRDCFQPIARRSAASRRAQSISLSAVPCPGPVGIFFGPFPKNLGSDRERSGTAMGAVPKTLGASA